MSIPPSEDKESSSGGTPPPRRQRRALPDLSALFDEESHPISAEAAPEPPPQKPGLPALDVNVALEPAAPRPRERRRGLPDLSVLSDDEPETGEESPALHIPPDLEQYISPDMWRKVNSADPQRGVLINALDRVRSVLYLLSTFLPQHLVQEKMRRPVPGLVSGQMLRGTLLFSDVSGFTALSERLAVLGPEGAERLTAIMNNYFTTMLEILSWSGGILVKFAGDATLVYFPEQENGRQAGWAVRAGQRMLRAMSRFSAIETPTEVVSLRMKIGVASGEFLASSVGSARRVEYGVLGPAVSQTMGAESSATGPGQLIVNAATTETLDETFQLKEHAPGYSLVDLGSSAELDDFEIKAETRRARGAIPWSASPQALVAQIEVALRQIEAITPYLASELVERIVVHARQRRVESEYRPTTVLFCNFTGLETLLDTWGRDGAQRVTSLFSAYFTGMHNVISRYGGIVSRIDPYSKGTKMLVLFGAPVAHEDDPQRAVSAALAMNAELDAINESWGRKLARHLPPDTDGPLIQHRIGITSGETFAGQVGSSTRREYTVMGDDVNLAARLMGAAEMGQILLSQQVHATVSDYFVLTPLTPVRVKGKSKRIPIFQVEGPRDDTLANRVRHRSPIVGREAELSQAQELLRQAILGQGSVLTIQGPPGIGKSHLADELLKNALSLKAQVLYHQCRSFTTDSSYACWSALLRSLAGITSNDYRPQIHHEKLGRLMTELKIPPDHLPSLALLMGLHLPRVEQPAEPEPTQERGALYDMLKQGKTRRKGSRLDLWDQIERTESVDSGQAWQPVPANMSEREHARVYEAMGCLLSNLSAANPLIIFFEDAHWMDNQSRQLLCFLNGQIQKTPLFLLLAQRGDDRRDIPIGHVLALDPLTPEETTAFVARMLVSDLGKVIHEQSNGNPLFVEQITRWFKGTWKISAEELKSVLQTSDILQKLVLSGVESLPEEQREIAKIASVIGGEFRTGEVQELLPPDIDPVTLSNHLRGLVKARFIFLAEAGADARYAYQQSLMRDILYNSLPYEQRRELHAKMAAYLSEPTSRRSKVHSRITAALEPGLANNPVQEAESIAYHYQQAGQHRQSAQYLLLAGNHARQQNAYPKAAACFALGLSNLEKLSPETLDPEVVSLKLQLCIQQGDVHLLAGDFLSATLAYEAAYANLPAEPPPDLKLSLEAKFALVLPTQRRADEAEARLRKAIEQDGADENLPAAAILGWLLWRAGKDEAKNWVEEIKERAVHGTGPMARTMCVLLAEISGNLEAAFKEYVALNMPVGASLAAIRWGDWFLQQGQNQTARDWYCQAVALWQDEGQESYALALAKYREAEVHWREKDADASTTALNRSLDAITHADIALQAEGRSAIQKALKLVHTGKAKRWPAWKWQAYDDAFHISFLFDESLKAGL